MLPCVGISAAYGLFSSGGGGEKQRERNWFPLSRVKRENEFLVKLFPENDLGMRLESGISSSDHFQKLHDTIWVIIILLCRYVYFFIWTTEHTTHDFDWLPWKFHCIIILPVSFPFASVHLHLHTYCKARSYCVSLFCVMQWKMHTHSISVHFTPLLPTLTTSLFHSFIRTISQIRKSSSTWSNNGVSIFMVSKHKILNLSPSLVLRLSQFPPRVTPVSIQSHLVRLFSCIFNFTSLLTYHQSASAIMLTTWFFRFLCFSTRQRVRDKWRDSVSISRPEVIFFYFYIEIHFRFIVQGKDFPVPTEVSDRFHQDRCCSSWW